MESRRIVLIGFRGTGKSTLALHLAEQCALPRYSTDECIARDVGSTIREIVERNGWSAFREKESQIIKNLPISGVIIDCGGGVVEFPANKEYLRKNSLVVWVDASEQDIVQRLKADDLQKSHQRPLLSASSLHDDIVANYRRRKPLYEEWSHVAVNTSKLAVNKCVEQIVQHFSNDLLHYERE